MEPIGREPSNGKARHEDTELTNEDDIKAANQVSPALLAEMLTRAGSIHDCNPCGKFFILRIAVQSSKL